jgi:choline-sulfatase
MLDRLAQEATIFNAAVAPGPRTNESFPGILAGMLSADSSFYDELAYKAIPSKAPTVATWLRDCGYRTVAVVSNPQLSPVRNFDRRFESFANLRINDRGDRFEENEQTNEQQSNRFGERISSIRGKLRNPIRERIRRTDGRVSDPAALLFLLDRAVQQRAGWPTIPGEDVITRLLSTLDSMEHNDPVFAWSHLNDLHAPLHPKRVRKGEIFGSPSDLTQYRWDLSRVADRYEPNYAAMYESVLRYVDDQIERVVEYLQANEMWGETILVVTADHGEALHDRGMYGHAAGTDQYRFDPSRDYMFEELLHVPLLVREPGHGGKRVRSPISLTWLHELLADVADLEREDFPRQSGRDDHIDPPTDSLVIADAISEEGHTIVTRRGGVKRISECLGGERGSLHGNPLLFDLTVDPGERTDLSESRSTPMLDEATEDTVTHPDSLVPLGGELDAETRELLEHLGYQ